MKIWAAFTGDVSGTAIKAFSVTAGQGNLTQRSVFGALNKGNIRYFCCPTGSDVPKCTWKGSPKLCWVLSKIRCKDNQVEVTTTTTNPNDGTSCWTGHMSLCCHQVASDSDRRIRRILRTIAIMPAEIDDFL